METFIDASNRHTLKAMANLELGEIEPIAFLENNFSYGNAQHNHYGIAFVARIRNKDPMKDLRATIHSRGHFIPYDDDSVALSLAHNDAVMRLARDYLKNLDIDAAPEFEIEENLKYKNRYIFHNNLIKPLFNFFGRFHFHDSLQDLRERTSHVMFEANPRKILDVACGENTDAIQFAKRPGVDLVVGNDVSWSQIQLMSEGFTSEKFRNISSFILFTNHDARRLPFADSFFDSVICKNVLHHMDDLGSVKNLINEVVRVQYLRQLDGVDGMVHPP